MVRYGAVNDSNVQTVVYKVRADNYIFKDDRWVGEAQNDPEPKNITAADSPDIPASGRMWVSSDRLNQTKKGA